MEVILQSEILVILVILVAAWIVVVLLDVCMASLVALLTHYTYKKAFVWGLWLLCVPVLLMAYGIWIERNWLAISEVEVVTDKLPKAFDGYRLVQLSDIHARSYRYRLKALDRVVSKVNQLEPDAIMFTGDIVTSSPGELVRVEPALSRLKAKDGIFSVLGNHDYCIYQRSTKKYAVNMDSCRKVVSMERNWGWHVLKNSNALIRRGKQSIAVVGVENTSTSRFFVNRGKLNVAEKGTGKKFRILLTHDPTHWDAGVVGHGYPLTLSGHTHSTQFSLFGLCPAKYIYKQYRGLYQTGDEYLYVNPGLGETRLHVRIGVRPEITLITLRRPRKE